MIRFKHTSDRYYQGIFKYLIAYDHSAGSRNRYTVLVLNVDDPVTIGRELKLCWVRDLIAKYEVEAQKLSYYTGDRKDVLCCMRMVQYNVKKNH